MESATNPINPVRRCLSVSTHHSDTQSTRLLFPCAPRTAPQVRAFDATVAARICAILPRADEVARVTATCGPHPESGQISTAECFVLSVGRLPQWQRTVRCWRAAVTFDGNVQQCVAKMRSLQSALSAIRRSKALMPLLGIIQQVARRVYLRPGSEADEWMVDELPGVLALLSAAPCFMLCCWWWWW